MPSDSTIRAGGGLVWKPSSRHGFRIAVIYRRRYSDWSLPKGKALKHETLAMAAAREVTEETGFQCAISRALTTVTYEVSGGTKSVRYFAARFLSGEFTASSEVDELQWLTPDEARQRLTYDFDRVVLSTFERHPPELRTLVLVRHAKAGSREAYPGPDDERPLDDKGRKQSQKLVDQLTPFAPRAIYSAPIRRCVQTLAPLAQQLALPITTEPELGEELYRDLPSASRRAVQRIASGSAVTGAVLACSQGGVIPGVVKTLAVRSSVPLARVDTPKGAFWVLSFDGKELVQADFHPAP